MSEMTRRGKVSMRSKVESESAGEISIEVEIKMWRGDKMRDGKSESVGGVSIEV